MHVSNLKRCQRFFEVLGLWDSFSHKRSPQTSSYHCCSCLFSSPIHSAYLSEESYCYCSELPLCLKVFSGSSLRARAELKLYSWAFKTGASVFNLALLPCLTLPQDKSSMSSVSKYTLHASLLTLFPWLKFLSTLPFSFPAAAFLPILPAPFSHIILCFKRWPALLAQNVFSWKHRLWSQTNFVGISHRLVAWHRTI